MSYTDVFGGANIYPSDISYLKLTTAVNVQLYWPLEVSIESPLVARIMDVDATIAGIQLRMPDARQAGPGETVLWSNVGSYTFTVRNYAGTQLINIAPGESWQLYLTTNTVANGTWFTLQFGAFVSNASASTLAGTGLVAVGNQLQQAMQITNFTTNYVAGLTDNSKTFVWKAAGSGTLTLPDPATVGDGWFIGVINEGGGTLTVDADGIDIDGEADKAYLPGVSSFIMSDGIEYYTLGYNQSAVSNFDYTVINVPGTGDYTLAGTELNRIAYRFTGILTGNRDIIVPDIAQQYWVDNATTGSFDLTVTTAAGTGIEVTQGARRILYSNGVDVVDADTTNFSFPLSIAQGGTGATTAPNARINLGATSIGDALFTAVDTDAAWFALGTVSGGTF